MSARATTAGPMPAATEVVLRLHAAERLLAQCLANIRQTVVVAERAAARADHEEV